MNFQQSIKQLTIRIVNYTNMTTEERIANKEKRRTTKEAPVYFHKWFGILPLAWRYVFKQNE